mmetsp:Transcript_20071/g.28844  ORF Transcript_20071/g.28844 Transcript_20071/m.28844 type:complete len:448 (+) Transcript_20071:47-1390(+)
MQGILFIIFLCILYVNSDTVYSVDIADIPNPMKQPDMCGRRGVERSMICDIAELIPVEAKNDIEQFATSIWDVEFAVVVIPSMVRSFTSSVNADAERYADTLLETWGVGDSPMRNGVLVFLSISDRVVHISLGAGIQDKLSSIEVNQVASHMVPHLKSGDYGPAIEMAMNELNMLIARGPTETTNAQKKVDKRRYVALKVGPWVLGVLFLSLAICALVSSKQDKNVKKGYAALRRVIKTLETSKGIICCPMCLDPFEESSSTSNIKDESNEVVDTTADNTDIDMKLEDELSSFINTKDVEYMDSASPSIGRTRRIPMKLRCHHIYCMNCIQSLVTSKGRECPICHQEVDTPSSDRNEDVVTADKLLTAPGSSVYISYLVSRLHALYPHVITTSVNAELNVATQLADCVRSVNEILKGRAEVVRTVLLEEERKKKQFNVAFADINKPL